MGLEPDRQYPTLGPVYMNIYIQLLDSGVLGYEEEDHIASCSTTKHMKATAEDEKLQGKINDEDKQKCLDKCNEIINWLDKNQTAEKEECEHQQKELEKVCKPHHY
ncbi:hypothetical protein EI555_009450 [Monodon monoceros]|uniref:Uncharacterized protein n=1 Tax=Monodon monoceros TaxID=40151 RepID=A0A4U1FDJ0_MONMO|nr:hypothetical protein EI555_009450 [Monodon monoceros]